jgi:hypothetical protein
MSEQMRCIGEIRILWAKSAYQGNRFALPGQLRGPRLWRHSDTTCNFESISNQKLVNVKNKAPGSWLGSRGCSRKLELERSNEICERREPDLRYLQTALRIHVRRASRRCWNERFAALCNGLPSETVLQKFASPIGIIWIRHNVVAIAFEGILANALIDKMKKGAYCSVDLCADPSLLRKKLWMLSRCQRLMDCVVATSGGRCCWYC